MKKLLIIFLLLMPMLASAQDMTPGKARQAGVVILYDQYVNDELTMGNAVFLRLKDESRNDNWRNGVSEMEYCYQTKVHTSTLVPTKGMVIDPKFIMIGSSSNPPEMSIVPKAKGISFYIKDKYGEREYGIIAAVFYKTYADVINGDVLGVEENQDKAVEYIYQMFKVYE